MAVYEFACPECSAEQEHMMSMTAPLPELGCQCGYRGVMKRLISKPAPFQLGGPQGIAHGHALIKKRNADYRKGSRYKDERRRDLESLRRRGID